MQDMPSTSGHSDRHRIELLRAAGLWVDVRIADPSIDCAVFDTEIGETDGIIRADRDVPHNEGHEVVNAAVPV
jgi:hypothetical protein